MDDMLDDPELDIRSLIMAGYQRKLDEGMVAGLNDYGWDDCELLHEWLDAGWDLNRRLIHRYSFHGGQVW